MPEKSSGHKKQESTSKEGNGIRKGTEICEYMQVGKAGLLRL